MEGMYVIASCLAGLCPNLPVVNVGFAASDPRFARMRDAAAVVCASRFIPHACAPREQISTERQSLRLLLSDLGSHRYSRVRARAVSQ
jgi:hypothetical protein